ncbi:hypothetical protein D1159_15505 [Pseudoflavonifractor sp. 524-17]|uniref:S-layer homology domain-containing protein n=1 Tax=Pseudoflavonifractor sp. 524-17 TaxID=2304577 RepID=UPI0013794D65|nr:hypothetical protein [Pseudoflavonifractor sp. 524-17]
MKTWKQWWAAVLTAAVVLSLTAVPAGAADTADAAYQAYYDFLQTERDSVGRPFAGTYHGMSSYPFVKDGGWINEELLFARLIDFDKNGIPELLFGKTLAGGPTAHVNVYDIYTYSGGQMVRLATAEDLLGCIDMEYHGGSQINYSAHISRDAAGHTYLLSGGVGSSTFINEEYNYYSVSGGKWALVDHTLEWFSPDIYISKDVHTSTGECTYYVGPRNGPTSYGTEVSASEYYARRRKYFAGGDEVVALNRSDVDGTLNQLSQHIDPNYAARYRTPSDWAAESVSAAIAAGIVPEALQKKYASPITRAEFCALAVNFYETSAGKTITQTAAFQDTSDPAVQKMAGLGIVTGIGNGKFNPDGLLTREAAAVILVRLSAALGNPPAQAAPNFTDNNSISGWAVEPVGQCQAAGIMGETGGGRFQPQGTYTREQSIVTLMRIGDTAAQNAVDTLAIGEIAGIPMGKTKALTVTSTPANVPNHTLTWTSSNPAVASVDGNGVVTGVSLGAATITAAAASGATAHCQVTVVGRAHSFFSAAPAVVRCAFGSNVIGSSSYFDVPMEDARYTATITINSAQSKDDFTSQEVSFNNVQHVTLHCTMGEQSPLLGSGYFKWTAEDASGQIIDKGVERPSVYGRQQGESFEVEISVSNTIPGESYTLHFYSYLP